MCVFVLMCNITGTNLTDCVPLLRINYVMQHFFSFLLLSQTEHLYNQLIRLHSFLFWELGFNSLLMVRTV